MIGITELFDIGKSIAAPHFEGKIYPWEALEGIGEFICNLGKSLSEDEFYHPNVDVWISKEANVFPSAYIKGPCIIDKGAEIRHCAFIRGNAIVGKGAVVGNSTELKNVILFDGVQVPHYNYVGDSILGYKAHMGAGSITSNVKGNKTKVIIKSGDKLMPTDRKKVGAMLGDFAEIGCGSVLNPGCIIGRNSQIYPLCSVRGVIPENCIYKSADLIIEKY